MADPTRIGKAYSTAADDSAIASATSAAAAANAAAATGTGIVAQAEDARDDAQTWAEGADGATLSDGVTTITKSAEGYADDAAASATALATVGMVNLHPDPFYARTTVATDWAGLDDVSRSRWRSTANLTSVDPDASNPYSGRTVRIDGSGGSVLWLDEMGMQPGDTLSAGFEGLIASGTSYVMRFSFRDVDNNAIGSFSTGTAVAGDGSGTQQVAHSATIAAATVSVRVEVNRTVGSGVLDVYARYAAKGTTPPHAVEDVFPLDLYATFARRATDGSDVQDVLDGALVIEPEAMRVWHAAMARARAGDAAPLGVAGLLLVGDSYFDYGGWPRALAEVLQAEAGLGGIGFVSFAWAAGHVSGSRDDKMWPEVDVTLSGTWTELDEDAGSRGPDVKHAEGTLAGASTGTVTLPAATATVPGTATVRMLYTIETGGGEFRWRVDGGSWSTIDTGTATGPTPAVAEATGLSTASSHTVDFEVTSGTVYFPGLIALSGDPGVVVYNCGNGSSSAYAWEDVDATYMTACWDTWIEPDCVVIDHVANDDARDALPDLYDAMTDLVDRALAVEIEYTNAVEGAQTYNPAVLLTGNGNIKGKTTAYFGGLIAAIRTVAEENAGVCMVDLYKLVGERVSWQSLGMTDDANGDSLHPSAAGAEFLASALLRHALLDR